MFSKGTNISAYTTIFYIISYFSQNFNISRKFQTFVKKYFIEAKTAPGNNDELSDAEALKILAKLAKQSHESAALFQEKGRSELAEEELAQAAVIEGYLPKALTPEEIEKAVAAIIQETGATSMKEMGKVMGIASRQLAGKADGKSVADTVKRLLS